FRLDFSLSLFSSHDATRPLPSFPTRRSSDLLSASAAWRPASHRLSQATRRNRPDREAVRHRLCTSGLAQPTPSGCARRNDGRPVDRKSTRLNSSHVSISYAVFCLKKKKKEKS